jgi:3-phenylpropionate/trans-cinnamate dioxygenase ferredoxin reductase subunit
MISIGCVITFGAACGLVIIGGGYIGLEAAAVANKHGTTVAVLESAPRVLARVTAPDLSAFYERVHREAGVEIRTGVGLSGFEFSPDKDAVSAVKCGDGATLPADVVMLSAWVWFPTPNWLRHRV